CYVYTLSLHDALPIYVYYLPSREIVFYNIDAISGDLRWARLKVIKEMLRSTKKIIVTSIDAFAATYTPKELYKSHILKIKVGDEDRKSTRLNSSHVSI